jgi:hypothetical protein
MVKLVRSGRIVAQVVSRCYVIKFLVFDHRSVRVEFVAYKVALGEVYLRIIRSFYVSVGPSKFHTLSHEIYNSIH